MAGSGDPLLDARRGRYDERKKKYDEVYNKAEADARSRNAVYFEAPVGNPDYLDVFKRNNPVRPLAEVPWESSLVPDGTVADGSKVGMSVGRRDGHNDTAARSGTALSGPVGTAVPTDTFANAMFGGMESAMAPPVQLAGTPGALRIDVPPNMPKGVMPSSLAANAFHAGADWGIPTTAAQAETDDLARAAINNRFAVARAATDAEELAPYKMAAEKGRLGRMALDPREDAEKLQADKLQVIEDLKASIAEMENNPEWRKNPEAMRKKRTEMREMAKLELEAIDSRGDYSRLLPPPDPLLGE